MWFGADSLCASDGFLVVTHSDELSLAFIRRNFGEAIDQAVHAVVGSRCPVKFELSVDRLAKQAELFSSEQLNAAGRQAAKGQAAKRQPASPATATLARGAADVSGVGARQPHARNDSPTLLWDKPAASAPVSTSAPSEFHYGEQNVMLEMAVRQVLEHPGKFNPLVLHGPVGCGKTHLLQTIVHAARRGGSYRRCLCQTAEQFTSGFIEGLQGKGLPLFRGKYRQIELLAVDDLQFLAGKRATLVEFQNTVESLLRARRQLVITANRPLHEMEFLGDSLRTRLSCGMTCPISWPDVEARETIARNHAREQGFEPSDETLRLVCRRMGRDVRLLKGAINRLHNATLALGREIDPETACELLGDLFQAHSPIVSLERIERAVCDVCGVMPEELRGQKRIQRVSTARGLAILLSRRHTTAGLAEIGEYYGGRNHSTIVAARKRIESLAESDAEIDVQSRKIPLSRVLLRLEDQLAVG